MLKFFQSNAKQFQQQTSINELGQKYDITKGWPICKSGDTRSRPNLNKIFDPTPLF